MSITNENMKPVGMVAWMRAIRDFWRRQDAACLSCPHFDFDGFKNCAFLEAVEIPAGNCPGVSVRYFSR